jgi:hypothetical protein
VAQATALLVAIVFAVVVVWLVVVVDLDGGLPPASCTSSAW